MCLQPIIELLNVRVLHSLPVFTSFEVYLAQLSNVNTVGLDGALQPPKAQLQRDYHRAAATVST